MSNDTQRHAAFPGFEHLYSVNDPVSTVAYRGHVHFNEAWPHIGAPSRGEWNSSEPVVVTWAMGRPRPGDVVWTTLGTLFILSEKVRDLLVRSGFTGWTTYRVRVFAKDGSEVTGYSGLAVTGRSGAFDDTEGRWVAVEGLVWREGLYFAPDTWDGSDFVIPGDSAQMVVAESVVEAFRSVKLRNVKLTSLSRVLRPAIPGAVDFSQSGPPPARSRWVR